MTGARRAIAAPAVLVFAAATVVWLMAGTPVALQAGPFRLVLGAHNARAVAGLASVMAPASATVAVDVGCEGIAIAFGSGDAP